MIGRRQMLAAVMILPIACSPSSTKACSIDLPLDDKFAQKLLGPLTRAWWSRDRSAFLGQFVDYFDSADKQKVLALFDKFFADPADERKLGNVLVRHNFFIFEIIESGTKRKSRICDGYPSAVIFTARYSAAHGGFSSLSFVEDVLFVPEEWDRG